MVLFAGPSALRGRDIEADPAKDYVVMPEAGPWMICANWYSGPQAPQLARDLVLEIRRNYQLPAYVFNHGSEERRKQKEEVDRLRQLSPDARPRIHRIEEQYAVLIGGYKDMDVARRALDDVKKLKPPDEKFMHYLAIAGPGAVTGDKKGVMVQRAFVNPFVTSFVVRNPTVPPERKEPEEPDHFLKELNAGESFSLLKCKKRWTLAVADFQGTTIVQPQSAPSTFLDRLLGRGSGDRLSACAKTAHNLAEALHKMGYEAYVLHTRYRSVVSVGSFDSSDDPRMQQVQRAIQSNLRMDPRAVQMLSQPVPMEVPQP